MTKHLIILLTVLLLGALVLAACGGGEQPAPAPTEAPAPEPEPTQAPEPTEAPAEPEPTEAPAEPADDTIQVGMVSDLGGIDDKSFNQTAWRGIETAQADFGIDGVFLESQQQTDYEKNINEFLSQDKDLI
ncbi:MAG: BMP family ABC transporter substrate-binding protein, partial [Chloroflexi bacterium]|nr:BMP family ABC transporter substrate-binding protein [Chloroflexota bacterium]